MGIVVVVRGGAVRCLDAAAVADVVGRAVTLADAGLEETPFEHELTGPLPPVVGATIHLRHSARVGRLAGRFLRHRLDGSSSTLVLHSRAAPDARHGAVLTPVAAVPVAEVAAGANFDLIVPIGEPGRRRYASPVVTLVASSLSPLAVARRLVAHRAFLGETHCEGDAALARMAIDGHAADADVRAALDAHEAEVVMGMLRDVVRSPC